MKGEEIFGTNDIGDTVTREETVMKNQGCAVRYYHDMIGYNYRLEGLQGAVLSVSLKYLPQWTKRRQEIGEKYLREIKNPVFTVSCLFFRCDF